MTTKHKHCGQQKRIKPVTKEKTVGRLLSILEELSRENTKPYKLLEKSVRELLQKKMIRRSFFLSGFVKKTIIDRVLCDPNFVRTATNYRRLKDIFNVVLGVSYEK